MGPLRGRLGPPRWVPPRFTGTLDVAKGVRIRIAGMRAPLAIMTPWFTVSGVSMASD